MNDMNDMNEQKHVVSCSDFHSKTVESTTAEAQQKADTRTFRERLRQRGAFANETLGSIPLGVDENSDLTGGAAATSRLRLRGRTSALNSTIEARSLRSGRAVERQVLSPADREVMVLSDRKGEPSKVLMFASNNYLGFANDPYVVAKVHAAIERWGVGAGGPPLINGYTGLLAEVEARIADLKGAEDSLVFSSGYGANVALANVLTKPNDRIFFDGLSHASFIDGLHLSQAVARPFPHNDVDALEALLAQRPTSGADTFVAVEGVYSMEGDIAPIRELVAVTRKHDGFLILDDAHGTGVLGKRGAGTAEHCGMHGSADLTMGTFSKVFAVTGGFLAGNRDLIRYLRFSARSYIFSAAPAPTVLAAISAGLDLLEREPERRVRLFDNVAYAAERLRQRGFDVPGHTPILVLCAPRDMDVDRACARFQELGIFVSAIEYPIVPRNAQRFRFSIMATHTRQDLDQLIAAVDDVWATTRRLAEATDGER